MYADGKLEAQGTKTISTTSNGNLLLMPNGTGNVGVNEGSPLYKLDVGGTFRAQTSLTTPIVDGGNIRITGNTIASTNTDGNIFIYPAGTGTVNVSTNLIVGLGAVASDLTAALINVNASTGFAGIDLTSERTSGNIGGVRFRNSTNNRVAQMMGTVTGELIFQTGATTANIADRWTITNTGILEAAAAQTITTSTGALTLSTSAGNGNIDLTPHGSGVVNITTAILNYKTLSGNTTSTKDKIRVWNSSIFAIGMINGLSYGGIGGAGTDFAMTFQMSSSATRGFWWGDDVHTLAQGAMALTTNGDLTVASRIRVGYGESDVTVPSISWAIDASGNAQIGDGATAVLKGRTAAAGTFDIGQTGATGSIRFVNSTGIRQWSIDSTGILESEGAETIRTSTGSLTLATNGGDGNIILNPHGTGSVNIPTHTTTIAGATFANAWFSLGVSTSGLAFDANEIVAFGNNLSITTATSNSINFYTANSIRWTIGTTGILESTGEQTIKTSTGTLTLSAGGGNSNVVLSPSGTGKVLASRGFELTVTTAENGGWEQGIIINNTSAITGESAISFKNAGIAGTGSNR